MFDTVGLHPELRHRYPHELSGGQRQRVGLARALILEPSVRRRRRAGLGARRLGAGVDPQPPARPPAAPRLLVPLHHARPRDGRVPLRPRRRDLPRASSSRLAPTAELFRAPQHPVHAGAALGRGRAPIRTRSEARRAVVLEGDPPSPLDPPSGCRFRTRCPLEPQSAPRSTEEEPLAARVRAGPPGRVPPRRARPAGATPLQGRSRTRLGAWVTVPAAAEVRSGQGRLLCSCSFTGRHTAR